MRLIARSRASSSVLAFHLLFGYTVIMTTVHIHSVSSNIGDAAHERKVAAALEGIAASDLVRFEHSQTATTYNNGSLFSFSTLIVFEQPR